MEKIGEIKARFAEAGERLKKASMRTEAESVAGLLENLEQTYREDTRSGVQALIRRSEKQREALEKETARIYQLQQYERDYEKEGLICGIDEVGRGPLAGPVVAGAVILPKNCEILYLNDSKQLSAEKMEQLYDVILEHAVAVGIGIVSPQRIDEINILQASACSSAKRCGKDSTGGNSTGSDHQGRCKKRIHCCSEHCSEGDEGPDDGAV